MIAWIALDCNILIKRGWRYTPAPVFRYFRKALVFCVALVAKHALEVGEMRRLPREYLVNAYRSKAEVLTSALELGGR